jgi:hypothetical protein
MAGAKIASNGLSWRRADDARSLAEWIDVGQYDNP